MYCKKVDTSGTYGAIMRRSHSRPYVCLHLDVTDWFAHAHVMVIPLHLTIVTISTSFPYYPVYPLSLAIFLDYDYYK